MYDAGDQVFLSDDADWMSARVLLVKKQGWRLVVTDHGQELNRHPCDLFATPLELLAAKLNWALYHAIRASDKLTKDGYSGATMDEHRNSFARAKAFALTCVMKYLALEMRMNHATIGNDVADVMNKAHRSLWGEVK